MKKIFFLIACLFAANTTNATKNEIHTKCPQKLTNAQLNEIYYNNKTIIDAYTYEAEDHNKFKAAMPSGIQPGTMYGEGGTIQDTQRLVDYVYFEGLESEGYDEIAPLSCTYEYETYLGYTYSFSIKRVIPDEVCAAYNYFGFLPDQETSLVMVRKVLVDTFFASPLREEALSKIKIIYDFLGIRSRSILEEVDFDFKNLSVQINQFMRSSAYRHWKARELAMKENKIRKEMEEKNLTYEEYILNKNIDLD